MSFSSFIPIVRTHISRVLQSSPYRSSLPSSTPRKEDQTPVQSLLTLKALQYKAGALATERQEQIKKNRVELSKALEKVEVVARRAGIQDRFIAWKSEFYTAIETHNDPDWNIYFLTNLDLLLVCIKNVWFPQYHPSTVIVSFAFERRQK